MPHRSNPSSRACALISDAVTPRSPYTSRGGVPMRLRPIGLIAALAIGALPGSASAQDEPRLGITMGYPASLGLIWRISDGLALRPELSFSTSSNELIATTSLTTGGSTAATSVNTNDNWQLGIGLSALFYLSKHDALRAYVTPRWSYTRASSESTNTPSTLVTSSTGNVNALSGSFGAEYALSRRFSVFGEVGLGYTHTTNDPTGTPGILTTSSTSHVFGARSGAGVALYF